MENLDNMKLYEVLNKNNEKLNSVKELYDRNVLKFKIYAYKLCGYNFTKEHNANVVVNNVKEYINNNTNFNEKTNSFEVKIAPTNIDAFMIEQISTIIPQKPNGKNCENAAKEIEQMEYKLFDILLDVSNEYQTIRFTELNICKMKLQKWLFPKLMLRLKRNN